MRVATIGIIGDGTMGSGIAQVRAGAGLDVVLTDVNEAIVKKGAAAVARDLDRRVAGRRLSIADKEAALAGIRRSTSYDALAQADVVIEAATEDLEVKQRILWMIDPLIRPDAIVASNTSSVLDHQARSDDFPPRPLRRHTFLQSRPGDGARGNRAGPADERCHPRHRRGARDEARQDADHGEERARLCRQSNSPADAE